MLQICDKRKLNGLGVQADQALILPGVSLTFNVLLLTLKNKFQINK